MYNMKQLPLHDEMLTRVLPSIFPTGIKIEWNDSAEVWSQLRQTFVEMWEKSWDRLYVKHMALQNILVEYDLTTSLEEYLDASVYTLLHKFTSFEELNHYLAVNKELRGNIKSWRYNIAIHYAGMTPVAIVLAEKNGKPQIQEASLQSRLAVDDIVWFPNL